MMKSTNKSHRNKSSTYIHPIDNSGHQRLQSNVVPIDVTYCNFTPYSTHFSKELLFSRYIVELLCSFQQKMENIFYVKVVARKQGIALTFIGAVLYRNTLYTVSPSMQRQGSIFQNGFLGGVQFKKSLKKPKKWGFYSRVALH